MGDELQALIEQAEAEAAEAEAAAAAARARARAIRSGRDAAPAGGESDDDSPPTPWYRRADRITGAKAAAVIAIVASLVGSGFVFWQHLHAEARDKRAAEFTDAARQGVIALTTLDFNHAKEDVQRIIDSSTGSYRDDFQARAADFISVVEASKAVTKGNVVAIGVESMSDDGAVLLVAVEESITNSAGAKDDPRRFRMRVSVAHDGDQIKLSKVEMVP